jgi:hypothetical protein
MSEKHVRLRQGFGGEVDDVLRDLASELTIEPSPELVPRVRAKVYLSGEAPARVLGWPAVVAVTFLLAAVSMGVAPGWHHETADLVVTDPKQISAPAIVAAPATVVAPRLFRGRAGGRKPAGPPASTAANLEVIVPPDQSIALRRILAVMRAGSSPVPPALPPPEDARGHLLLPRSIEIPEITIEPLTLPNGGGSKGKNP